MVLINVADLNKIDIYSSTKPLWILSKAAGLYANGIPQHIVTQLETDKRSLLLHFSSVFWCIYVATILISSLYFSYVFQYSESVLKANEVVRLTDELGAMFNIATFCITIVYNYVHRNSFKIILQEFVKVESDMIKIMRASISYKHTRLVVFYGLLFVIIEIIFLKAVFLLIPYKDWWISTQGWILYYILADITDIHLLQFLTLIFILCEYLKKLKHQILEMQNENTKQIELQQVHMKNDQIRTFLCIKRCSRNLYGISLKINNIFSVPLFFSLANSFVLLFSGIYFTLFGFIYGKHIFIPKQFKDFIPTMVLLLRHFVKLGSVAALCEYTCNIRKDMAWELHNIKTDGKDKSLQQNVRISLMLRQL